MQVLLYPAVALLSKFSHFDEKFFWVVSIRNRFNHIKEVEGGVGDKRRPAILTVLTIKQSRKNKKVESCNARAVLRE